MTKTTRWPRLEIEDTTFDVIMSFKSDIWIYPAASSRWTLYAAEPQNTAVFWHTDNPYQTLT